MPPIVFIGIGVAIFGLIGALAYVGLRDQREVDPLQERLAIYAETNLPESLEDIELQIPFKDRILIPILNKIAEITIKFTPQKQLEHTRRQLELAGMNTDPARYFLLRIITTVFFTFGALLFAIRIQEEPISTALLYGLGGAVIGFQFPMYSLSTKIRKRQENVIKSLPDALDLLVIAVEAGLGFDQAMGKVYEKWEDELAIEFGRVLREIQLGKLRREALKDMSDRLDVADVNSFTAAIIQADSLGVSIGRVLRVQSDQMRIKRRQRAQEKAQQAPVKMMIPMVILIFPSIWIVLLGPALLTIMGTGGI